MPRSGKKLVRQSQRDALQGQSVRTVALAKTNIVLMIIKIYLSFGVYVFLFLYIIVCLMVGQNDVKVSNPPPIELRDPNMGTVQWGYYVSVSYSVLNTNC